MLLLLFVMLIIFTGCMSSSSFTGESESWAAAYVSEGEHDIQYATYTFVAKNDLEDGTVVEYEITAEDDLLSLTGSGELTSNEFTIEQECTDCNLRLISRAIVIHLTWDGKSEQLILR